MKRKLRVVVVSLAFALGVALFFTSTSSLVVVRPIEIQVPTENSASVVPRHRFSTSDDMRYIRYGVGDQFTPYHHKLLDYIRSQIAEQSPARPRNLPKEISGSQYGQAEFVDRHLSGRRNGFFVECGAADGVIHSNSLFFELERNWTGLLIEANPNFHRSLLDKNRHAYVLGACLSPVRRPAMVSFLSHDELGGIADTMKNASRSAIDADSRPKDSVNCFPLNSIAAALNITHIDYFSLDVEGAEEDILQTIDWKRLRIDVISIEYQVYGGYAGKETLKRLEALRKLFRDTGMYRELGKLPNVGDAGAYDVVFSRVSLTQVKWFWWD